MNLKTPPAFRLSYPQSSSKKHETPFEMHIRSSEKHDGSLALPWPKLGTDLGRQRAWAPRYRERHQKDGHTRRRVTHSELIGFALVA